MAVEIFLAYAPKDKTFLEELDKHLKPLEGAGVISCWDNRDIEPGLEPDSEIIRHLDTASIILLLISSDFLSSDFYKKEICRVMRRHESGKARVIPIYLRSVDWDNTPFRHLEPLPRDGGPIKSSTNKDKAFTEVAREVSKIVGNDVTTRRVISGTAPSWKSLIGGSIPITDSRGILQRQSIVHDVYTRLTQPGVSALVLTGLDGVGKSTIAALVYSYARRQQTVGKGPFIADPIWINVDSTVTMEDLSAALFEKLGRRLPDFGRYSPQKQAVTLFQALDKTPRPFLIVLDQFDQLLNIQTNSISSNRPALIEWINTFNTRQCCCRILITSRYFPLDHTLAYVQKYVVRGLEAADGAELLRKEGVEGSIQDLQDATNICSGNALALKLLASILNRHDGSLHTFLENTKDTQFWKESVAGYLVDSIYTHHLDELQQLLLIAFSIYREAVVLEAAEAVLEGETRFKDQPKRPAREVLLNQGLLQQAGKNLYQVQVLITEYLQTRLAQYHGSFNLQVAHDRAARYYLQQVDLDESPEEKRASIENLHDLIEAIWHLCQAEQWSEAYILMHQQGVYEHLKLWGENKKLLDLLLLFLPVDRWCSDKSQEADIYNSLGMAYNLLGKKTEALRYYKKALKKVQVLGDQQVKGVTLRHIGRVCNALGEKKKALKYFEDALSLLQDGADRDELGKTYERIGRVYYVLGQKEQAKDAYEKALEIYEEVGNASGEGTTRSYLGRVYSALGQAEEGLRSCMRGLRVLRNIKDRRGEGRALDNLGRIYHVLKQYNEAQEAYEKALKIAAQIGDRGGEGIVLQGMGDVYISLGQKQLAQETFEKALIMLQEVEDKWREGVVLNSLASVCADLGQKALALQYYKEAVQVRRGVEDYEGESLALYDLGKLYLNQQDYKTALACFLHASTILEERLLSGQDLIQQSIEELRSSIDEDRFAALSEQVKPQALELVEDILLEES